MLFLLSAISFFFQQSPRMIVKLNPGTLIRLHLACHSFPPIWPAIWEPMASLVCSVGMLVSSYEVNHSSIDACLPSRNLNSTSWSAISRKADGLPRRARVNSTHCCAYDEYRAQAMQLSLRAIGLRFELIELLEFQSKEHRMNRFKCSSLGYVPSAIGFRALFVIIVTNVVHRCFALSYSR